MANPEHVAKLKEGSEAWSQWREQNPSIRPDLCEFRFTEDEFKDSIVWYTDDQLRRTFGVKNSGYIDLTQIDLSGSDLNGAYLWSVLMQQANFEGADLSCATIKDSYLAQANLHDADMSHVTLSNVNLSNAHLSDVNLFGIRFNRKKGRYIGIRLGGCYGSERFKRFALHQAFIEELSASNRRNRFLADLWAIFADCGRTPWRWLGWSAVSILLHANIYWWVLGEDSFHVATDNPLSFEPWVTLYYSIVTFTTLGFGDITPTTFWAMFWVTSEVIAGYMMLGGLISFMFSKLLPR